MLKDLCFEVIQTCPNKCKFCSSNSSMEKKKIIKLEDFKRTIMHFVNHGGIEEVSISGGEPFLHPHLYDMVQFSKENGIRTVIFTSGIKRADDMPEEMIEYIQNKAKQDLEEIEAHEPWNERLKRNVRAYYDRWLAPKPFDAISNEEFQKLVQLGLEKIVFDWQALEEIVDNDLMGRKGLNTYLSQSLIRASNSGLNVDIHFIPMKPNYRQLPDIIEMLNMLDIPSISLLNFVPQGRGRENKDELMLSGEELAEFGEIVKQEQSRYKGKIRIGIPLNGRMSHLCTAGTEKLDIKYDGTILPCPAFKEIDIDTMQRYGIRLHNIYDDLEQVVVTGGKRAHPLCKQVYGFKGSLTDDSQDSR